MNTFCLEDCNVKHICQNYKKKPIKHCRIKSNIKRDGKKRIDHTRQTLLQHRSLSLGQCHSVKSKVKYLVIV